MTNYAQYSYKTAKLNTEFGETLARKWFGDAAVDELPKFSRGKNKGKPKGILTWRKLVRGGWVRTNVATASGQSEGYVENEVGKLIDQKICRLEYDPSSGYYPGVALINLDEIKWKEQAMLNYKKQQTEKISELDKYWRRMDLAIAIIQNKPDSENRKCALEYLQDEMKSARNEMLELSKEIA